MQASLSVGPKIVRAGVRISPRMMQASLSVPQPWPDARMLLGAMLACLSRPNDSMRTHGGGSSTAPMQII